MLPTWFRKLIQRSVGPNKLGRRGRRQARRLDGHYYPRIETLENRIVPTRLSIPTTLTGIQGGIVTVPINVDALHDPVHSNTGLTGADLVVYFNPSAFTVSNSDVAVGTIATNGSTASGSGYSPSAANGWSTSFSSAAAGVIHIGLTNDGTGIITGTGGGTLVTVNLHIKSNAPAGSSFIDLGADTLGGSPFTSLSDQQFNTYQLSSAPLDNTVLSPAYAYLGFDPDDGLVTIAAKPSLLVTNLTPTTSGFVVNFNQPFDPTTINLYDNLGSFGATDVTLTSSNASPANGPVSYLGSLVLNDLVHPTSFTFVKTSSFNGQSFSPASGTLTPGTYTVTLRSAANGFHDGAGDLLSDINGVAGNNYVTTFVVTGTRAVVGIPSFARGPGDTVVLPNNAVSSANGSNQGIPINLSTITSAEGITSGSFTLQYNPQLLTITGANGVTLTGGQVVTLNVSPVNVPPTSTTATATITFTSSAALPNSTSAVGVRLGVLTAVVPNSAASSYGAVERLTFTSASLNGGVSVTGSDAVQVVAYLGDASFDGQFSPGDASLIQLQANSSPVNGILPGFSTYPLVNPVIIADLNTNGSVDAPDITLAGSFLSGTVRTQVPPINPNGLTITPVGPDPMANNDTFTAGSGTPLTVASPGILANDTDQAGNPLTVATVNGQAANVGATITLASGATLLANANGSFTYTPPTNYFGPDSFTYQAVDSIRSLTTNTATVNLVVPAHLSIPTTLTAVQGGTVTVPVNLDNPDPAGSGGIAGAALAIDYDPNVFTVTTSNIALGTLTSATNDIQTITFGGAVTGGTFTLFLANAPYLGNITVNTGSIAYSTNAQTLQSNIQSAMDAMLGAGNTLVAAASATSVTITFQGNAYGASNVPTMTVTSNLSGASPTAAVATTTQGFAAWFYVATIGTGTNLGQIGIAMSSLTPNTNTVGGSLVLITFQVNANASGGPSAINLAGTNSPSGTNMVTTRLDSQTGQVPLRPAVTNASTDVGVDGSVAIAGATHFGVVVPATALAGVAFSITVTAQYANNGTNAGYAGTVHFTSSDGQAVLPADATLTGGVGTFTVTLKTPGAQTITATDAATGSLTGTSCAILTSALAASQFVITGIPSNITAGTAFNFTVSARDQTGSAFPGYAGTVHFSSSDGQALLPTNGTLTSGVGVFSATLRTGGSQTLTATDTVTASVAGTATLTVNAAAASTFSVIGPAIAAAGLAFTITVTAKDAFGNIATGYAGTVHFTSSDSLAALPADATLTNGVGSFSAALKTLGLQTLTATDTVTSGVTGNSSAVTVSAAASHFAVTAPSTATAGTAIIFVVTAQDAFGNTATAYAGTVHFTSSDGLAGLPANATLTNGVGSFSATLKTATMQTLTATDTASSNLTGSTAVTVKAAAAAHFTVTAPSTATAGTAIIVTVTALDAFGNTANGYTGTVHFTSSDANGLLPADATLSNGKGAFSVTLKTAAVSSIIATDTATLSIFGITSSTVSAAAATQLVFAAGSSVSLTSLGVRVNNGVGTFLISDNSVYWQLISGTYGTGTFVMGLDYDRPQQISFDNDLTVTIQVNPDGSLILTVTGEEDYGKDYQLIGPTGVFLTEFNFNQQTGVGNSYSFPAAWPTTCTAGQSISATLTAEDAWGNTATAYSGTVHFSSSDGGAVLPANTTLSAGTGLFAVTLHTAGLQTITATDAATSSISGTSPAVTVSAAALNRFAVTAGSSFTIGKAFNFTVTAQDQFGNKTAAYNGTIHFTSSDAQAVLPANATLSAGVGIFSATLKTPGTQTLTAADTVTAAIMGTSLPFLVSTGIATHFAVTAPVIATAGRAFSFTVQALDSFNNIVPAYTGTVHFTTTDADPGAAVPADYTFVPADNGIHVFTGGATLVTVGNQTLTATDTASSSITGNAVVTVGVTLTVPTNLAGQRGGIVNVPIDVNSLFDPANSDSGLAGGTFVLNYDPNVFTVSATDVQLGTVPAAGTGWDITANAATPGSLNIVLFNNGTGILTSTSGGSLVTVNFHVLTTAPFGISAIDLAANSAGSPPATNIADDSFTDYNLNPAPLNGPDGNDGSVTISPAAHFAVSAPATVTAGNPFVITVTAQNANNSTNAGYNGTVHFTSSDSQAVLPADATLSGGVATFSVTLQTAGSQTLTAGDTVNSMFGASSAIAVNGLMVSSVTPTPTGFVAQFNEAFDPTDLNLYDAVFAGYGPADVTLQGSTGPAVRGSLVLNASDTSFTFLKTGTGTVGLLAAGTYTVTLRTAASGFKDSSGNLLAGNSGSGNFVTTFTVAAPSGPVLSIPDFARGPDGADNIKIPNKNGTGIPITLTNAVAVTDVTFQLNYNPALLNISGALNGPSGTFTLLSATGGVASFTFHSATALSGNLTLGQALAQVPDSAASIYKAKELLHWTNIVVNGGSITAVANDGIHVDAYLGDTNGDGTLSAGDSSLIARVGVSLDTGLTAYPLLDPSIVASVTGNGSLEGADVTLLNSYLAGTTRPQIPPVPAGLTIVPTGPDPALSVPTGLQVTPGATVLVPVDIDTARPAGSTGLIEAVLALRYDPRVFSVSAADVQLGSLPGSGWQLQAVVNAQTGEIGIDLLGATPIQTTAGGSLVTLTLHVRDTAPAGTAGLSLVSQVNPTGQRVFRTEAADTQGALVLHPASVDGGQWTVNGEQLGIDNGQWTADGGQLTTGNGQWTAGGNDALAFSPSTLHSPPSTPLVSSPNTSHQPGTTIEIDTPTDAGLSDQPLVEQLSVAQHDWAPASMLAYLSQDATTGGRYPLGDLLDGPVDGQDEADLAGLDEFFASEATARR